MRGTNTGADCSFTRAFTASTASCSASGTTVETQGLYGLWKPVLILVSDDVLIVCSESFEYSGWYECTKSSRRHGFNVSVNQNATCRLGMMVNDMLLLLMIYLNLGQI